MLWLEFFSFQTQNACQLSSLMDRSPCLNYTLTMVSFSLSFQVPLECHILTTYEMQFAIRHSLSHLNYKQPRKRFLLSLLLSEWSTNHSFSITWKLIRNSLRPHLRLGLQFASYRDDNLMIFEKHCQVFVVHSWGDFDLRSDLDFLC